jgi:hypothetical protein
LSRDELSGPFEHLQDRLSVLDRVVEKALVGDVLAGETDACKEPRRVREDAELLEAWDVTLVEV